MTALKYIDKAQKIAVATPPDISGLSAAQLAGAISAISRELQGHGVSPAMRIAMNEDRKAMRKRLAEFGLPE